MSPTPKISFRGTVDYCHHQSFESCRVELLPTFRYNSPVSEKPDGWWRMTIGYCEGNHVAMPVTAAVPAVVSVLEQITTAPGS